MSAHPSQNDPRRVSTEASVSVSEGAQQQAQKPVEAPRDLTVDDLDKVLEMAIQRGMSDVHLRVNVPPIVRNNGKIVPIKLPPLPERVLYKFIQKIIPPRALGLVDHQKEVDFGFSVKNQARFRVNLFYELGRPAMVMRIIPWQIPALKSLGLPEQVHRFGDYNSGLVLVTGPTGVGKSTTLAALLNEVNLHAPKHIITIEDPIEFVYQSQRSIVTQREIGVDTDSFSSCVKYALRQDPDVILIGELRDRETVSAALHAAETGHLVLSTLHTSDAVQTIYRIINMFEPHERDPVRLQLASILRGTISQKLIPHKDGVGRVAIAEVMTATSTVADYIQQNKVDMIYQLLKETELGEMCSMNASLMRAVQLDLITGDDALKYTNNPVQLQQMLRGAFHGSG